MVCPQCRFPSMAETNPEMAAVFHPQGDVGGKYGEGPSMNKRLEAINRIKHPWLK